MRRLTLTKEEIVEKMEEIEKIIKEMEKGDKDD